MKWLWKLGVVVVVVLVIGWFVYRGTRAVVPVAAAVQGTAVDAVTGTVKLLAAIDLQLKTEVPGRIREMPITLGQFVKKGDLIATLESTDFEMQLSQRRIQLAAALARSKLPFIQDTEITNIAQFLDGQKISLNSGSVSAVEVEKTERDLERAKSSRELEKINRWEAVNLLEQQVKQLEFQLERMKLRSPYDGQLVEQLAFPGDWLWSGNALARIVTAERTVELTLSEEDYYGVQLNQKATLHLASLPGQSVMATVNYLSATANADTKIRKVFLAIDDGASNFAPGLTGEAVLVKAQRDNTVIIPRRALIGDNVYVIAGGRVDIRKVTPGYLSLNKAEIREGLKAGELVALENQLALRAGDAVQTTNEE
ncbi:MAG: efflux RND transporter periplasmic adaptor subunit [Verrucomicrobiota bacterium]|nr:efflux RND transporter periplasmic adaptor subunit [Verrucomicrobiota bacterium]